MAAVLGGEPEAVSAALAALGLTPANVNGGGQVVAAGSKSAIAELVANPPERARVIELQVAGAFHTHYMSPAVDALSRGSVGPLAERANRYPAVERRRRPRRVGRRRRGRPRTAGRQPCSLGFVHGTHA